jgi:GDP-D-mannose dehydratase
MYSLGDPKKAAQVLDWRTTVTLPEIVARMIRAGREAADNIEG